MLEEDTYTLIPNGWEYTGKQGPDVRTPAYLVQHDQTGLTIKWKGASPDNFDDFSSYSGEYMNAFRTFVFWSKGKRSSWKKQQVKQIKQPTINNQMGAYLTLTAPSVNNTYVPSPSSLRLMEEENWDYDSCCSCSNCQYYKENFIEKKETNMYAATKTTSIANTAILSTVDSETSKQRQYLEQRLWNISDDKYCELRKHFKLDPVESPRTVKELIEKIKSDDFSYDEKYFEKNTYDPTNFIRWTKEKADHAGFNAAEEKMQALKQKTMDAIKIKSPEDGLAALEAFESATFH